MEKRMFTRSGSCVLVFSFFAFVMSAGGALGQCSKDTDCKGNRICVKGSCVDPTTSVPAPQSAESASTESRPSEGEVKGCVDRLENLGRMYGNVIRLEFGTPMPSQGGMTEMELGAPKGTLMYPVRLRFHDYRTGVAWVYRDPFGTLKCAKHGDVEYAPPTTPEEMAAAIKDGETIRVPVKIFVGYAPNSHLSAGTLAVSTTSVTLKLPEASQSFTVTTDHVYPVDTQNWQLHLRLEVTDPYRHNLVSQDVYLWDPGVQQRGNGIDCSRCGDAMTVLLSLLQVARQNHQ